MAKSADCTHEHVSTDGAGRWRCQRCGTPFRPAPDPARGAAELHRILTSWVATEGLTEELP